MFIIKQEKQILLDFFNEQAQQNYYNKLVAFKDKDTARIHLNIRLINKWLKREKLQFNKKIYFNYFEHQDFRKTYQTVLFKKLPLQLTDLQMTAGSSFKEDLCFTKGLEKFGPEHLQTILGEVGYNREPIHNIYVSKAAYHWFVDHIAYDLLNLKKPFFETHASSIASVKRTALHKKRELLRSGVRTRSLKRLFRFYYYYIRIAPYTRDSLDEFYVHNILKKKFFFLTLRALKKTLTRSKRKKIKKSRG